MSAKRNSWHGAIYADTPLTAQEIAAQLAQTLRGSVSGASPDFVRAEHIDLEVRRRDERPPSEPVDPEDAFLYFRGGRSRP